MVQRSYLLSPEAHFPPFAILYRSFLGGDRGVESCGGAKLRKGPSYTLVKRRGITAYEGRNWGQVVQFGVGKESKVVSKNPQPDKA